MSELLDRGAAEACILVLDGDPGLGKTTEAEWWAVQNNALFVRAKTKWTEAWMLREILETLNVTPQYSYERMYKQALEVLGARASMADTEDATFAVVVDEIDHIVRSDKMINTLRDLSDMLEIPFVFVGVDRVGATLARNKATAS
ncbi:MAG: ATP-binding protein, partial [Alphaproteobacteria bacterium]|nr:ATP-binding protein [Alphaproteobacteria bacterium]